MATEPSKPKTADHGKKALSMRLAKAMVRQGQVEAAQAEGGQRDHRPDPAGQDGRHEQAEQGTPAAELVHGVAAQSGEGELADGDVAAPARSGGRARGR